MCLNLPYDQSHLLIFLKKLNMMKTYFERLEEVFEVNIQVFMQ